jgi:hypothetical protein
MKSVVALREFGCLMGDVMAEKECGCDAQLGFFLLLSRDVVNLDVVA